MTILLIALFGLLFSLGTTSGSGSSVTAAPVAPPVLKVEASSPLVVRGTNFRPGEQVTVTAYTGTRARPQSVTVRAVRGSFRAPLGIAGGKCGGAKLVRARGDKGSVAVADLRGGICIPPPRD